MKLKKGITPFVLAVLITVCSCYYIPFYVLQKNNRAEIQNTIKNSTHSTNFVTFSFSPSEFRKIIINDEKEFLKDEMNYDLISVQRSGEKIVVLAYKDGEEKNLFENLEAITKGMLGKETGNNSPLKSLGKISSVKYLFSKIAETNSIELQLNYSACFISAQEAVCSGYKNFPYNPPKQA